MNNLVFMLHLMTYKVYNKINGNYFLSEPD